MFEDAIEAACTAKTRMHTIRGFTPAQWVLAERKLKYIFESLPTRAAFYDPTEERFLYSSQAFRASWDVESVQSISLRELLQARCDEGAAEAAISQIMAIGSEGIEIEIAANQDARSWSCVRLPPPANGILFTEREKKEP